MGTIAQQELFEAPARRRLIVPKTTTSWWGVDGSTRGVAIGVTTTDDPPRRAVRTAPFPRLNGPPRLSAIYADSRALAMTLAERYPPGLILIEQPSGSSQVVNHELEYAVGVIQAAVYDGVFQALGHGARIETVVSSWWKAKACGKGNIYKTEKVNGRKRPVALEEYGVMRWARLNGYQGSSWDEADALAIAEAGRRDVALERR